MLIYWRVYVLFFLCLRFQTLAERRRRHLRRWGFLSSGGSATDRWGSLSPRCCPNSLPAVTPKKTVLPGWKGGTCWGLSIGVATQGSTTFEDLENFGESTRLRHVTHPFQFLKASGNFKENLSMNETMHKQTSQGIKPCPPIFHMDMGCSKLCEHIHNR